MNTRTSPLPWITALALAGALRLEAQAADDSVALRLALNVPAYRLEARVGDSVAATVRVAIGQRQYRTPVGRFDVTEITWNPWWIPPASEWARSDTVTPPCPANPMGVVKLGFGNGYFIHGTPAPTSVGSAASHGCVRAANGDAQALAELIVRQVAPDRVPAVREWAAAKVTRRLVLPRPVPLDIRYDLAEVRGDSLHLYPDVYGRAPGAAARALIAMRALAAAGVNTERVEMVRLERLIYDSRRGPVAVALGDLLLRPAAVLPAPAVTTGGLP